MKQILLTILLLSAIHTMAQDSIKVYKTHNHYINNDPNIYIYNGYRNNYNDRIREAYPILFVIDNGKKKKIVLEDYWGFVYKDILFRRENTEKTYIGLLSTGKLFYWESALSVLKAITGHSFNLVASGYNGHSIYLSSSLEGELRSGRDLEDFFAKNPDTKQVPLCYEKDKWLQSFSLVARSSFNDKEKEKVKIRACVESYNGNFIPIYTK